MDQYHGIVPRGQFKHRCPVFPDRVLVFLGVKLDPHALFLAQHCLCLLERAGYIRVEDHPLQQALDVTHARLRQLRGLKPGEEDDFALMTQDQLVDVWGQLTGVLFIVMVGLSSIGLLVGGVGVIGIMMISVTERTREIGLRKSLGARQRDIMWQFLVEASTLTVMGGSAGMLIGGGIVWALNTFSPVPATTPLWAIIAALGASAMTGIGFGLYPASRASRLEPVDALRYE